MPERVPDKGPQFIVDRVIGWTSLCEDDTKTMLWALIGDDFGPTPEKRIPEIKESRKNCTNYIADKCAIGKEDVVLDLGSGCGFGTYWLAQRGRYVYACDISPAYIKFASKECSSLKNVSFHLIESNRLDFLPDDTIDAVCSTSVFIHLNLYDIFWYFDEFRRVVKPDGRVFFDIADSDFLDVNKPDRNAEYFLRHAKQYKDRNSSLAGLMQWNSPDSVIKIADYLASRIHTRRRAENFCL